MFKNIIKKIIPIKFRDKINGLLKRNIIIKGNYGSWNQAVSLSGIYNNNKIFIKTKRSFLKVLSGEACYERDSVLFYEKKINRPLILLLEKIKKKYNKKIQVLDFGGSLGSTFFQNRSFLENKYKYRWDIIEQKKIVEFAKRKSNITNLFFFSSLSKYLKYNSPDIVIFSSVLHYLNNPFKIINLVIKKKIKYILILKTPFYKKKEEIKIQINPEYIYKVNYPIRIFNEFLFKMMFIKKKYKINSLNWDNQTISNIKFKSFFLIKL